MTENSFFFNYEKIQVEEFKKKQSLLIPSKDLFENFIVSSPKKFDKNEINDIKSFFSNLLSLDFDKIYKNYLTHPIRVAHMWILINQSVTVQEIKFALAHNIIENGFLDELKNNLEIINMESLNIKGMEV